MSRTIRTHVSDTPTAGVATPKHLSKLEFGRRVYERMMAKGWRQADLARAADLPRDSISTYVRGKSTPEPVSLQKLATALGCTPADLYPNHIESAIDEDHPSLEIKVSPNAPTMAWLRVNRLVPLPVAVQVASLLEGAGAATDGK